MNVSGSYSQTITSGSVAHEVPLSHALGNPLFVAAPAPPAPPALAPPPPAPPVVGEPPAPPLAPCPPAPVAPEPPSLLPCAAPLPAPSSPQPPTARAASTATRHARDRLAREGVWPRRAAPRARS